MTTEFSPRQMLIDSLTIFNNSRARSQQVEIGVSSIGGCTRKVYYQLTGQPEINETEHLASLLGTFIHSGIEEAIKNQDPFGDNFLIEEEVEYAGLKGHVDLYIKSEACVVDWKTSKLSNYKDFPSLQYQYQVHIYAYLLKMSRGIDVKKVAIVSLPRDGKMPQIVEYFQDYDENLALEGIAWLEDVKNRAEKKDIPDAEEFKSFCNLYCQFYDPTGQNGCPSKSKQE